jgi:hypothetical protein
VTRQPNPLWVDNALKRHWDALQARVGKRWMPVLSKSPATQLRGAGAERGRRFYEFGTGSYGTVLPTRDPRVVLKISSDKSEIEFVLRAEHLGMWPSGLVKYYRMLQLSAARSRPIYAIWREEAYAVGAALIDAEFTARRLKIGYQDFREGTELLQDFYKAGRVMFAASARGQRPRTKRVTSIDPQFFRLAQELSRVPGFSDIGKTLLFYLQHGIVLADVHTNNVGLVNRRGKAVLVITDPGHAVFLQDQSERKTRRSA